MINFEIITYQFVKSINVMKYFYFTRSVCYDTLSSSISTHISLLTFLSPFTECYVGNEMHLYVRNALFLFTYQQNRVCCPSCTQTLVLLQSNVNNSAQINFKHQNKPRFQLNGDKK